MHTFTASEVQPRPIKLPAVPLARAVESRTNSPVEAAVSNQPSGVSCTGHPVIQAAHNAFVCHLPLILSPDDIWLCIAQGFGAHVNVHAQELRSRLVAHAGKQIIQVRRDNFVRGAVSNDWPGVVAEFSDKLAEHIGPTRDLVVANFSTTGVIERTASQITLMSAMQAFFGYQLDTFCGIPSITLLGDTEDWKSIRRRVVAFGDFGLEHWVRMLTPILDQFVATSDGRVDPAFWRSIYKTNSSSGESKVTGWINVLFPYLDESEQTVQGQEGTGKLRPNPHMDEWQGLARNPESWVLESHFPPGLSVAPFIWNYLGEMIPMELVGGFVGLSQDPQTLALRPAIGWGVRDEVRNVRRR